MFNKNIFAQRLIQIRINKNIMAKDVARELGTRTSPINKLVQLAKYFDISKDYLLGRTNNPNSHKK